MQSELRDQLKELLESTELSMADVSRALDHSERYLANKLNGQSRVRRADVLAVRELLGEDTDVVWVGAHSMIHQGKWVEPFDKEEYEKVAAHRPAAVLWMQRYPDTSNSTILPDVYETKSEAEQALEASWAKNGPTV